MLVSAPVVETFAPFERLSVPAIRLSPARALLEFSFDASATKAFGPERLNVAPLPILVNSPDLNSMVEKPVSRDDRR